MTDRDRLDASRDAFVHASNTIADVRDFLLVAEMALIQEDGDLLDDARKAIATLVSLCHERAAEAHVQCKAGFSAMEGRV